MSDNVKTLPTGTKSLNMLERLTLSMSIPQNGNIVKMKLARDVAKKLEPTQDEIKEQNIVSKEDGSMVWSDPNKEKEIEFTDLEEKEIRSWLEKMNKEEKITPNHISLCDKFNVQ